MTIKGLGTVTSGELLNFNLSWGTATRINTDLVAAYFNATQSKNL